MKNLQKKLLLSLTALSSITTGAIAAPVTLDTLVLYSQGAADKYEGDAETRISHLIETTNKIYLDSGLEVKLNVVKVQKYDMNDSATSGTILGSIRSDEIVKELRNQVGADNVIIYRPYANDGACGMGYQNNYLRDPNATWVEKYMYAHVTIGCGGYVTAHEVGHNAGLGHSEKQGSTGAYEYARGHGVQDTFTTVMAYSGVYNGSKVYKYSSPSLECTNGLPCGIEEGEDKAADAVKALKQTLPLIENFRVHIDVPDNNNTDDTNGTTDDGAKKLADALKAFTDQKDKVAEDRTKLSELRDFYKEKRAEYLEIRTEYTTLRQDYYKIRAEYRGMVTDYRADVAKYRVARTEYRARRITRAVFIATITEVRAARAVLRKYRAEVLKPEYAKLKAFRVEIKGPAYATYKEAITAYRDFYTNTYKVDKTKLAELRKAYLELKKVYG